MGHDVSNFYLGILNEGLRMEFVNKATIVLLPKVQNPTSMANFRPISLCTVIYKIIAQMVVNQFRLVLNKCIDQAQNAFVPGCLITDNILVAYEVLHTFQKKKSGGKGI